MRIRDNSDPPIGALPLGLGINKRGRMKALPVTEWDRQPQFALSSRSLRTGGARCYERYAPHSAKTGVMGRAGV